MDNIVNQLTNYKVQGTSPDGHYQNSTPSISLIPQTNKLISNLASPQASGSWFDQPILSSRLMKSTKRVTVTDLVEDGSYQSTQNDRQSTYRDEIKSTRRMKKVRGDPKLEMTIY